MFKQTQTHLMSDYFLRQAATLFDARHAQHEARYAPVRLSQGRVRGWGKLSLAEKGRLSIISNPRFPRRSRR